MNIELANVSKRYPLVDYMALDDVSLTIDSGEWAFLVGASGMGKTTLLKMLYREELCDQGNIVDWWQQCRRDAWQPAAPEQWVSSSRRSACSTKKTAFENIAYGAEVLAMPPAEVRRRTREILELVGLGDKANRLPGELSGGEQQRVAIGRALINRPKLILADEPTGDLDPENSNRVIEILDTVHREHNVTVLFATHAVDIVDRLQRRVVRLQNGRVVSDASGGYWADGEVRES